MQNNIFSPKPLNRKSKSKNYVFRKSQITFSVKIVKYIWWETGNENSYFWQETGIYIFGGKKQNHVLGAKQRITFWSKNFTEKVRKCEE